MTTYRFIQANRGIYAVTEMTALLGVSSSAYYRWAKYGMSDRREKADAELVRLIREIVLRHHRRYGSPRVHQELRRVYGKRVSRKKVAALMRQYGLNARLRRTFVRTTHSNHGLAVCDNLLNRDFHAERAGQKWVSDITYLRTTDGWVYLTIVLDLFDRKIIGWALSADLEAWHTVVPALSMAMGNRQAQDGLLFHSDRGAQYCSTVFRETLARRCPTVRQSMSRKGNCWDNAVAESFFKTLKRELETMDGGYTAAAVRQSVFMYVEAYYNRVRIHSALDYLAPDVFDWGQAA